MLRGPLVLRHACLHSAQHDVLRAFLEASAEGYKLAAANPREAATLFCSAVEQEYASTPLPDGVPSQHLVQRSLEEIGKVWRVMFGKATKHDFWLQDMLTADGRWGVMDPSRWESFLDWLSSSGLLTTKVQSRAPKEGVSVSLDGLRAGDAGDVVPRESVKSGDLMVSMF